MSEPVHIAGPLQDIMAGFTVLPDEPRGPTVDDTPKSVPVQPLGDIVQPGASQSVSGEVV